MVSSPIEITAPVSVEAVSIWAAVSSESDMMAVQCATRRPVQTDTKQIVFLNVSAIACKENVCSRESDRVRGHLNIYLN